MEFRWNEWNLEHVRRHGVKPHEAERGVRNARRPYPLRRDADKWLVRGPGISGRLIQVYSFMMSQRSFSSFTLAH